MLALNMLPITSASGYPRVAQCVLGQSSIPHCSAALQQAGPKSAARHMSNLARQN